MVLSPSAHRAAITSAMPARMSGDTRDSPRRWAGPITKARWGSQRTMPAPMSIKRSTNTSRRSNIFWWISTVPRLWVATTRAMLMRSGGKPGQGMSSIFGIAPSKSGTTESS